MKETKKQDPLKVFRRNISDYFGGTPLFLWEPPAWVSTAVVVAVLAGGVISLFNLF